MAFPLPCSSNSWSTCITVATATSTTARTLTSPWPGIVDYWVWEEAERRSAWVPCRSEIILRVLRPFAGLGNVGFHSVTFFCDADAVSMEPLSTLITAYHEVACICKTPPASPRCLMVD